MTRSLRDVEPAYWGYAILEKRGVSQLGALPMVEVIAMKSEKELHYEA
ncbi:MAG: hypothetical protein Q8Q23_05700 [bacterium]|nr:hypothetical protein [bacterium]